ncbi:MAG: hypothetical protein H6Q12_32 [Bacteroidetes bacterium]|nr:hypothetical protein [Bacteroidota bacterium]
MNAELEDVLQVVTETASISGMEPEAITLESGEKIRYNKADSKKLYRGGISEEEYISRNLMPDLIE